MTTGTAQAGQQIATIVRYYDACTTRDLDQLRATLHPDVIHYFLAPNPGSTPVAGAEHLARYWRKVARMFDARWVVDHVLAAGHEVVIEWSMFWRPEGTEDRIATRGSEWFVFRDGLIAEIRSYYQQHDQTTELEGFPYPQRRYSLPDAEWSAAHPRPPTDDKGQG
jgi:ketosteroid isomerase-like protein